MCFQETFDISHYYYQYCYCTFIYTLDVNRFDIILKKGVKSAKKEEKSNVSIKM